MASPLAIAIGLHYWTTPTEYAADDENHRESPAVKEIIAEYVAAGLLVKRKTPSSYGATYEGTEGLRVYVEALCAIWWPQQIWQIPASPVTSTHHSSLGETK
jgi:hypothetical protein